MNLSKPKTKLKNVPFVSICTPTFNRRPFIPILIKCIQNQTYPKDKIEWIIIDDGSDKIEDLVINIPYVKYIKLESKMSLGKKRNFINNKAKGDIIIYMDDDDYYPPERIQHAVDTLKSNPKALCAGSSIMHIYFKDMDKMYQFGPYGPNHATAATFAFRKELLDITNYDDTAEFAEEKYFLKNYTIPFVQLEHSKTILVVSHNHNSFDKKYLLNNNQNNPNVKLSNLKVEDFIKEEEIRKFFLEDIDNLLDSYECGKPEYKPELLKKMNETKLIREKKIEEYNKNINEYQNIINKIINKNEKQNNYSEQSVLIQELINENKLLKEKVSYLENKLNQLIKDKIQSIKNP